MLRTMLRKHLLILLAASLIAIAAPLAAVQSSNNDSPSNSQQSPQEKGGWRHGPPDPTQRTQELTRKLSLTSDQQTKVQEVFQSERSQMESVRQDNSLSQQDRHSKMMDIHKSSDTQIRALLDSTQQKKWDEMQAKREQWMQKGRQGPPEGGDQAPPPQL